jgi:hypothetical protein
MKRVGAILAAGALLLWLSLMQSRSKSPDGATAQPRADEASAALPVAAVPATAPAAPPPAAAKPDAPQPAQPSAPQASQPAALPSAATPPAPGSELIPLPPRHDRPHYTPAQARAGSPGKILGHAFAREKPDAAWSPGAEAAIRNITSGAELAGQEVLAVECRSSICKLQMRYDLHDRDKFDIAFGKLHDQFGTDLGFEQVSQMDDHGKQLLRVYVMREGKVLRDYPP